MSFRYTAAYYEGMLEAFGREIDTAEAALESAVWAVERVRASRLQASDMLNDLKAARKEIERLTKPKEAGDGV